MPDDELCPWAIDCFPLPEQAAHCVRPLGHTGPHEGPSADPEYSATSLQWQAGDRRLFTPPHPGRCGGPTPPDMPGRGVCVLPYDHPGDHAP